MEKVRPALILPSSSVSSQAENFAFGERVFGSRRELERGP
jgi:hypothetical protein